ncbi:hypothetical protein C5167_027620 [Papaver somniferum]|uniref:alpha-aminoadipic semialdehyde synthase-like n=1 Tax=Papaver somniferum TaxID=3469 RepID=UPI000E700F5E|nr:alpha-aminoadipic semialdehyde synthase-like [Papaver somniferum]RZC91557.1 hypothetical protein C5167_027620 [Papaver somniferum]
MIGNGVVGILSESRNKWERRAPLTPSQCARLLHGHTEESGVTRIIVQSSTKRIHHDALYEDVGCEISENLTECGLILGIEQTELEMILPNKAYALFSHTHKAEIENMPLLDKILAEKASLFDYELIAGDHGKRLHGLGKFAGRAGVIDFLHGLGIRYLSMGYSTPFLSLGASYMYTSLAAAKAAVSFLGEEIATHGLPSEICPLVFVFTGDGNVCQGAQEIFKLLPHTFVDPLRLSEISQGGDVARNTSISKRVHQVYGCVVTSRDMVEHKDPTRTFDKADYYAHPEDYNPIFHGKIAPYASVIVNCVYWEKRFPRLLSTKQLRELKIHSPCKNQIERPFFRYDPVSNSYHKDLEGKGVICLAIDILPTAFAKEYSEHFGDILSEFIGNLASAKDVSELPSHLRRACIASEGDLTSLYEYIPRMRKSDQLADICWENLGFSLVPTDQMYMSKHSAGGNFSKGGLRAYGNIELSPASGVLNYGQGLFEGLKAYRKEDGSIVLFRPMENASRMVQGAERMSMPSPTVEQFVEAVKLTVLANKRWIPPVGKGSLYIRPLVIGSGAVLGVAPAPEYTFLIYVSPVGNYFKGLLAPINLVVESDFHRATPGGTGGVKTIGNYAAVMKAQSAAKAKGYSDVLYLDSVHNKYLEEASSSNIFLVKGNTISTPAINGTILPGITRKSIIEVARIHGYEVEERLISVDELPEADEVFCTGTAVVVSPVGSITYLGKKISYGGESGGVGAVSRQLYSSLTNLQMGLTEDKLGWTVEL